MLANDLIDSTNSKETVPTFVTWFRTNDLQITVGGNTFQIKLESAEMYDTNGNKYPVGTRPTKRPLDGTHEIKSGLNSTQIILNYSDGEKIIASWKNNAQAWLLPN